MTTGSGLIVVDKPASMTSHQVVGRMRRVLGTRRIGHAGTLDPMATGVLVLGVNRATRLLGHLALKDKRYVATVRLGQSSDTDDAEGTLTSVGDAATIPASTVAEAAARFRGDMWQVPSSVSAIKVQGQRAYRLVRSGQDVELAARRITISRLDITSLTAGPSTLDVGVDVECSSGTYIRAIARDLGDALGVGGHLIALRRTRVGGFDLDDAHQLDALDPDSPPALMPMAEAARRSFPCLDVDAAAAADIRHGRPLTLPVPHDPTGMIGPDGELLALYRPTGEGSRPVAVLAPSNQD